MTSAQNAIDEYEARLGENWTAAPVDELGTRFKFLRMPEIVSSQSELLRLMEKRNDPDALVIMFIDQAIRGNQQLPDPRVGQFRHNPTTVGQIGKARRSLNQSFEEALGCGR